ncbi:MAG: hypothetical protein Tsb0034_27700 [Ekhidna sp.]
MKHFLALFTFLSALVVGFGQTFVAGPIPDGQIGYTCPPCGCAHDGGHFDTMGTCPSCNMDLRASYPGLERAAEAPRRITAGMLLFKGADIMDVTGPWSVFTHNHVQVLTFAKSKEAVTIGGAMELTPDFTLETLPDVDILVFPGSGLAESNPGDSAIQQFIKQRASSTEVLFSVCSGAFFLAEAGLLNGQQATTFASLIPVLKENYPEVNVVNNLKYTDNGQVVTTAGLSSGIDGTFHVISKFRGQGRVQDVANHMEYPWSQSTDYARSQLADKFIIGMKEVTSLFATSYLSSHGDMNSWTYSYELTDQVPPHKVLEVIQHELQKTGRWELTQSGEERFEGIIANDDLGKAHVNAWLSKADENYVLTLETKRLTNYEVTSKTN